jgi:hypothetical protein
MDHLSLIKSLGFRRVGAWRVDEDGLGFEIEVEVRGMRRSLYAFVSGEEVLYIGKSLGPFSQRLSGYRRPGATQRTNIRINPLLADLVRTERDISIYHFLPVEEVRFKGVLLNLAAGLEDTLIESISPKWNMNGRNRGIE